MYIDKENLALNNLQWFICHKTQPIKIIIYLIYMFKEDLALNNLQWLICQKKKKKKTQTKSFIFNIRGSLNNFLTFSYGYLF